MFSFVTVIVCKPSVIEEISNDALRLRSSKVKLRSGPLKFTFISDGLVSSITKLTGIFLNTIGIENDLLITSTRYTNVNQSVIAAKRESSLIPGLVVK